MSQEPRRPTKVIRETIETVLVAVVLALLIRTFVVEPYWVRGHSMVPTLVNGERLLVNKFWFHISGVKAGEIIIFHPPLQVNEDYVKRVIALGGQSVSMTNGTVYVNGKPIPEPWEEKNGVSYLDHYSFPPEKVKAGTVFVLGDNRAQSQDSRFFGDVPVSSIRGQAFFVLWPFNLFGPTPNP